MPFATEVADPPAGCAREKKPVPVKVVWWTLLAAIALTAVLLFNYWASFQPLSTLAYCGIVLALGGLANLVFPFRFLGIRKRAIGGVILAGGLGLAVAALLWPPSTMRVAQHRTHLDDILPEYQFNERHVKSIHARPEQVMQAVRQSTLGDLKSLVTLMRIRAAALRTPYQQLGFENERVLDALYAQGKGYVPLGGTEHEIVMGHVPGGPVRIAFNFSVEDAGGGWSSISTETRVLALDASSRRIMALYWRLIVPGSGLLRRQWLEGIKKRAENASDQNQP